MEEIIRMIQLGSDVYLHKEDIINLIEKVMERAETLSARVDLKSLITLIEGGEWDPNKD